MPFAGFKDWGACHSAMMKKYKSKIKADKVCGKLKALHEAKHEISEIKEQILAERKWIKETLKKMSKK